jgi:tetratricopeptide (TPR) repeat protein
MASRAAPAAALLVLLLSGPAHGQTPHAPPEQAPSPAATASPPPLDPAQAATDAARAHFKTGIKLYRDGNYPGALAEFEAAYELKPGPGSLQNVALCQKALFRYGEAADTLTRLLQRHASELSEAERVAAELARDELKVLVGSFRLRVTPPDARVMLDGQPLSDSARASAHRVNVGEHTLVVEAPGYARAVRTFRIAGGQEDVAVNVALEPIQGFVDVRASDPAAAIAIDGHALALGRYLGPVTPGQDHLIQVYRAGFEPYEERVRVDVGQTLVITGKLGKRTKDDPLAPAAAAGTLPPPPEPKPPVGWYGMGAFNLQGTAVAPFDYSLDRARSLSGSIGVRAGYRLRAHVAAEGLFELGALSVKNAAFIPTDDEAAEGAERETGLRYSVRWARLGPVVRIMSAADYLRISGGLGTGVVWHQLREGAKNQYGGVDPFLLLELGVASNWRHFLFGLDLFLLVDGTRGMNVRRGPPGERPDERESFPKGRALSFIGLGVRVGYSQWGSPF